MNSLVDVFKKYGMYFLILLVVVIIYFNIFGIYSVNDVDNAWSAAWINHFYRSGITQDMTFCDASPLCWGTRFFSKTYAYFYGAILSGVGFSLSHIQMISHFLIFLGLLNWFFIAKKCLDQVKPAFWFVILLSVSVPVISVANSARVDALVFFFMSFSFYLWLNNRFFASVFMACLAIETHPIGGVSFFYLFSYWLCYQRDLIWKKRFWFQCLAGLFIGGGLYTVLHFSELNHFSDIYPTIKGASHDNFIYAFFYQNQAWQYIEDLVFFSLALLVYFLRINQKRMYFLILLCCVMLSSFVFRRANPHYAIFFYPALFLFAIHALWGLQYRFLKIEYVFALVLALDANHYIHLAHSHQRARQLEDYLMEVRKLNLPKSEWIYADAVDYFAFYDYPKFRVLHVNLNERSTFYFLEHEHTIFSDDRIIFDSRQFHYQKIKTIHLKSGGMIHVYFVEKNRN